MYVLGYATILENILHLGFEATIKGLREKLLLVITAKGNQDHISLSGLICDDDTILSETFSNISEGIKPKQEIETVYNKKSHNKKPK